MSQHFVKVKVALGLQLEIPKKLLVARGFELRWEVLQGTQI